MVHQSPAHNDATTFGELLRQLRREARLTQEELAEKTGLSPRSISDLERGESRTAQKTTALLLADALNISDSARTVFVRAARGRAPIAEVLAALGTVAAGNIGAAHRSGDAEMPAGTLVWYGAGDGGLIGHNAAFIETIDGSIGAPGREGSVVTGVWLIRHDGFRWHRDYVPLAGGVLWFVQGCVQPANG